MRKLLSPDMGGVAIQATDKRSRCPGWIALDEQVDMIWHDLQRVNYQPILGSLLAQQSLQAFRYGPTSTGRRYFGHHTTWYFSENTAPGFFLYAVMIHSICPHLTTREGAALPLSPEGDGPRAA